MNRILASSRRRIALAVLLIALGPAALTRAGVAVDRPLYSENVPTIPKNIGIDQKLGQQLPLDLQFTDETGKAVRLADYFHDGKPVLLNLVYFECPALCNLALNGEVDALRNVDLVAGKDFRIVTVSFNPNEKPELAARKKLNYIKSLGKPEAAAGWAFLTGDEKEIHALADAAGFRYQFNNVSKQYEHDAALMIITPDGRFSRYLPSVVYEPKVLRLSIIEASGGQIGSLADQVFLACFKYDSAKSAYVPIAFRIMQAGAAATVVALAMTLGILWLRENQKKKLNHVEPNPA